MVDFGYPISPFAVGDLAGPGHQCRWAPPARRGRPELSQVADRRPPGGPGRQATRRPAPVGHCYDKGDRTPHPDPEVAAIIGQIASEIGDEAAHVHRPGDPSAACCSRRSTRPVGSSRRASPTAPPPEIDVMWLNGFGFPALSGRHSMHWPTASACATSTTRSPPGISRMASAGRLRQLLRQLGEAGHIFPRGETRALTSVKRQTSVARLTLMKS